MNRRLIIMGLATVGGVVSLALVSYGNATGEDPSIRATVKPRGNTTLEEARQFRRFPLLYAGDTVANLPLVALHRVDAKPYPGEEVRMDELTFFYGTCESVGGNGCMAPLQIQVWNACERNEGSYDIPADQKLLLRGVPAAFYEGEMRLELYTGRITVVLFAPPGNRDRLLAAAAALRSVGAGGVRAGERLTPRRAEVRTKDSALCAAQLP